MDQVRGIVEHLVQSFLVPASAAITPLLAEMSFAIVCGLKIRFSGHYLQLRSEDAVADQINMRTYAHADESVVSSRGTVEPTWLTSARTSGVLT
jgi:hypothetical protein